MGYQSPSLPIQIDHSAGLFFSDLLSSANDKTVTAESNEGVTGNPAEGEDVVVA
jgi:hypothetical protein